MWLFCEAGFFSIVDKDCAHGLLMVRARKREDLVRLGKSCPTMTMPMHTPDHDYAWRAYVQRQDLGQAVAALVDQIDYANFKDRVRQVDPGRMGAYHGVWSVMSRWQDGLAGRRRQPGLFDESEAGQWERGSEAGRPARRRRGAPQ